MMAILFILLFLAFFIAPAFLQSSPANRLVFPIFLALFAVLVIMQSRRDSSSIQRIFERQYGMRKGRIVFLIIIFLAIGGFAWVIHTYYRTLGAVFGLISQGAFER
jgi:hypothetical protein